MPELPATDGEMLFEYDFTRGVRGKHYKALCEGHAVRRDMTTGIAENHQLAASINSLLHGGISA
jgi:hypothetical protein